MRRTMVASMWPYPGSGREARIAKSNVSMFFALGRARYRDIAVPVILLLLVPALYRLLLVAFRYFDTCHQLVDLAVKSRPATFVISYASNDSLMIAVVITRSNHHITVFSLFENPNHGRTGRCGGSRDRRSTRATSNKGSS